MVRCKVATLLLILTASPSYGQLGIEKIEASLGKVGPVRKTLEFFPYDEITFRFVVTGAKDNNGTLDVESSWIVLDDQGKEVKSNKQQFGGPVAFGVEAVTFGISFHLPETLKPGVYILKATLKDNNSGNEAGFDRKVKLKAMEFAIVSPQFFQDREFTVPAPAGGIVGQQLYYQMGIIGFERTNGKTSHDVSVEVFDKNGKVLQSKPVHMVVEDSNEKNAEQRPAIGFSGWMGLSRPGEFVLRIIAIDRNSKKTATFETPLRVTAP